MTTARHQRLSHSVGLRSSSPMDDLSDNELAQYAARVFRQGLIDGRSTYPRGRDAVMLLLPPHPRRIIHTLKFRQIYGAGYDIARAVRLTKLAKEPAA